jgi:hypothetical protein
LRQPPGYDVTEDLDMKRYLVVLLVAAASLVGAQAYAHHSFAATYLEDKNVTIEGDIVQFLFRNPHSWVHVNVKEKNGAVVRYAVEWGGTGQLGQQGVTRDSLKIGDHVIISGNPARNKKDHRVRMLTLERPKDGFGWGRKPGEVVE